MARTVLSLVAVLTMLAPDFAFAADVQPKGLSNAQFERAVRNTTTATPFVLVTVVNNNTGAQQAVCVKAESLVAAIRIERGFGPEDAVTFALSQPGRVFKFSKLAALKRMLRGYSDQTLKEARALLAKMTNEEVVSAARNGKSSLYGFIYREPLSEMGERYLAVAHVLEEHGLLAWAGSKPGDTIKVETR